jgi:hypothetical protein
MVMVINMCHLNMVMVISCQLQHDGTWIYYVVILNVMLFILNCFFLQHDLSSILVLNYRYSLLMGR